MTREELKAYALAQPFKPFFVRMADGKRFVIRGPSRIGIGQAKFTLLRGRNDHFVQLDIEQVSEAGPIDEGGLGPRFRPRRILNYIVAEPFRPFRISLTTGKAFEIRHAEMVQVGRSYMTILTDDPQERRVEVSLRLVESLEPLT
jgi:hypothetical protein